MTQITLDTAYMKTCPRQLFNEIETSQSEAFIDTHLHSMVNI